MSKRFTDTEIWREDWFINLSIENKLLFFYIKDNCDHAGIWKVNIKLFNYLLQCNINPDLFLQQINEDKKRIYILTPGKWLLVDFFIFQYGNTLNINNKVHKSILKIYEKNKISPELLDKIIKGLGRGMGSPLVGVKDKDKDLLILKEFTKKEKEEREEKEKKQNTDFPDFGSEVCNNFTELRQEMITSEAWQEQMAMHFNMDLTTLQDALQVFLSEQELTDNTVRSLSDLKHHFLHSLKKTITNDKRNDSNKFTTAAKQWLEQN